MNTKDDKQYLFMFAALMITLCLVTGVAAHAANSTRAAAAPQGVAAAQVKSKLEQQRSAAKENGEKAINKDAVAAVEEARNALKAIDKGKTDQAIAAIERATGKITILTARNPAAALLPVSVEVNIVDLAPTDEKGVRELSSAAEKAVSDRDYPKARALFELLASEIRVSTYQLPLATYPAAMQEAARLLDQKKADEAKVVLNAALGTLVMTERSIPLPLTLAQAAVKDAQAERLKDKPAAQKHLAIAKASLERAKTLGYESQAPDYATLNQSIVDLDNQLNGKEDTTSAFATLKGKLDAFFDRLTGKTPLARQAKK